MKNIVIKCFGAAMFVVLVSSCGGDSVGTKAAKEVCECISEATKTPIPEGEISFRDVLASLGCSGETAEKYKEYLDLGEDNVKFKDPKLQKDFDAAFKKCASEWDLPEEFKSK
jgi:hypothetical protein